MEKQAHPTRRQQAKMRGRASRSNRASRYDKMQSEPVDDGWDHDHEDEFDPQRAQKTDITLEAPRTIINYINSPYVPFDRSINPYRGCEHGCIYCFARPSHAYYGLSPGLDFETRLFAKPQAAALLRKELSKPRYSVRTMAIGTNTDPYQPAEKQLAIMRDILGVLDEFHHPVSVLTKSSLVARDKDILGQMGARGLSKCMLSITTLDHRLARTMEPRASSPKRRFETVRILADQGVKVGVMAAPMIPGLNDHELEAILEQAKAAGATYAGFTIVRLPQEVADLFTEWLEANYPDRAKRVLRHIRDMNGGKIYDRAWSRAPSPRSVYARLIASRFEKAVTRLGLSQKPAPLDISQFKPPFDANAVNTAQLSLCLESST